MKNITQLRFPQEYFGKLWKAPPLGGNKLVQVSTMQFHVRQTLHKFGHLGTNHKTCQYLFFNQ